MREPVFNETVQLGIVVRDLEATVRRYVDEYGIGPLEFAQIDAGDANNYREYDRPVELLRPSELELAPSSEGLSLAHSSGPNGLGPPGRNPC